MALLVGCLATAVGVAGELECDGPYKGRTPTPEELATVLSNHQAWVGSNRAPDDARKANLCQARLGGAALQKADLWGADLQGASLRGAALQGALLIEAHLQDATLYKANLQEVVYEPNPEKLPSFWTLADPRNHLDTLVFHTSPAGLIALREAFKKGGMRTQERQLTYAIEHTKRLQAWDQWEKPAGQQEDTRSWLEKLLGKEDKRPWLEMLAGKSESLFSYVLFELPSAYGMVPSRALITLGLLILVFSLVYMVALLTARGRAGIWVTWPTDRVYQEEGAKEATRVTNTFFFPRLQARAAGRWWGVLLRGMSVPLIGLYFSLLSAFSLGWRELNVGTWIARVQPREYTLRATGWVRTVAGFQSLLSVYLLALWVLTYFGRPFE
jgi:pentapeptide repeat protein